MHRRLRSSLLAVATGSTAALGLVAAPGADASRTLRCPMPPIDGAGYFGLSVRGTTCKTGRAIIGEIQWRRTTVVDRSHFTVRVGRSTWRCRIDRPAGGRTREVCARGAARAWLLRGA